MTYKDLKAELGFTNNEAIRVLQTKYPKLTKVQISMVCNEQYGVCLSNDALILLIKEFANGKRNAV